MTKDELKRIVDIGVQVGSLLAPMVPGEWDDRIVDGFRALQQSDAMLEFIASLFGQPTFAGAGGAVVLTAADGTEHKLDPATIAILVQVAMAIIKLIRDRRNS